MSTPTPITDTSRLCVHTVTTKPWSIEEIADRYPAAGVKGITVWRQNLEGRNIAQIGERLRGNGMEIVSLCRGGFFPAKAEADRKAAIDDNRKAIEEAAELGAPLIVLVCGATPGMPLSQARDQIVAGIEALLPDCERTGVKLGIEPLHPMYADARSAVNTMKQANDLCERIGSDYVGVAVDVYHLWWDEMLKAEIARCGDLGKLFAFHVCDWKTPTTDLLNDRGLMGEGCINIPEIRAWVEATGFKGFNEVEIFSYHHWERDQHEFLREIVQAYQQHV
ncbi:MAG: sugar phosphate isomerase/epimerase family protein [Verrucomicrobiota bacterium JB022]|nr:sugar phosphate isomerase/epimerase family protein [Verrucomicrobiota bacterium JB022]